MPLFVCSIVRHADDNRTIGTLDATLECPLILVTIYREYARFMSLLT